MTWWHKKPSELEGGDALWSAVEQKKSGTSEAGSTVQTPEPAPVTLIWREKEQRYVFPPEGAVDGIAEQVRAEAERNYQVAQALEERPVFSTGEVLFIRGGFFKVKGHAGKRLYLDQVDGDS